MLFEVNMLNLPQGRRLRCPVLHHQDMRVPPHQRHDPLRAGASANALQKCVSREALDSPVVPAQLRRTTPVRRDRCLSSKSPKISYAEAREGIPPE